LPTQSGATSRETALWAAGLVSEKKGRDLVVLEVGEITHIADYFLICTGTSDLQVQAIVDHLREKFNEQGYTLLRLEGYREARWVLMDYGDLVVHVFQPEERAFYNLERLWSEAPELEEVPSG